MKFNFFLLASMLTVGCEDRSFHERPVTLADCKDVAQSACDTENRIEHQINDLHNDIAKIETHLRGDDAWVISVHCTKDGARTVESLGAADSDAFGAASMECLDIANQKRHPGK